MKYSIVIPVYNEEANVGDLFLRLQSVMWKIGEEYEIIFVNDGSTDKTLENLKKLSPIKIINFRKNFGQTAVIDAGIKESKGKIIITMDGDLQNDPFDIPMLIQKISEGYDVVSGWRWRRQDPVMKIFFSWGANLLRKLLISDTIHDSGCSLKAYRCECFVNIDLYGEMHRFIPAILQWRGYKVAEIKVNHFPRRNGKTKYSWKRAIHGFVDMLHIWFWRKYSTRPLHLFGALGIFSIIAGFFCVIWLFFGKLCLGIDLTNNRLITLSAFLILIGVQFFVSGLITDIVIKNYYLKTNETPYNIKEVIENK